MHLNFTSSRCGSRRNLMVLVGSAFLVLVLGTAAIGQGAQQTAIEDDHPQFGGWITFVESPGIGRIAVHIQQPERPRYVQGAPVIVNVSGFFTSSSGFDFEWASDAVGVIYITYLWPGKSDLRTGQLSDGTFDYGGPNCLAALRDVIRFATGETPNVTGQCLHELIDVVPLYEVDCTRFRIPESWPPTCWLSMARRCPG